MYAQTCTCLDTTEEFHSIPYTIFPQERRHNTCSQVNITTHSSLNSVPCTPGCCMMWNSDGTRLSMTVWGEEERGRLMDVIGK